MWSRTSSKILLWQVLANCYNLHVRGMLAKVKSSRGTFRSVSVSATSPLAKVQKWRAEPVTDFLSCFSKLNL